ncbi:LegC family aminotransferase [Dongia sedimenti]|uniref:LegC family aminotransferase n=1 Tax=Dongia sedimenti TaxID=3064282 RepID=A0ABU0YNT1_9PROT|nr:LegC family aminotransferase [Rhodospirillaceae bacterium R-7]
MTPAAIKSDAITSERSATPAEIVAAIRAVVGPSEKPVQLHEPKFTGNEWAYVKDCIDTGWVSYNGAYVAKFEQMLCDLTGAASCAAVANGTVAIEIALRVAGVKADEEVLSPSLTFVATNNAIAHVGAVPHFVDSDERTLGMDPAALADYLKDIAELTDGGARHRRTGRRIAAILPMHVFGHPVDMDALNEVATRWRIPVIEDAAEAIGSTYKGRAAGNLAPIAAMSFNGNKIITTGGGGAILSQDPEVGKRIRYLTTTAKQPHPWEFIHDEIAWNFRLPNINAAMGVAGLEQLPQLLEAKRRVQERYERIFAGMPGVSVFRETEGSRSNYWLSALLLDAPDLARRDSVLQACHDAGLMTRACWRLSHHLPMYQDCPRMPLDVAERLQPRIINLPSSPFLGQT